MRLAKFEPQAYIPIRVCSFFTKELFKYAHYRSSHSFPLSFFPWGYVALGLPFSWGSLRLERITRKSGSSPAPFTRCAAALFLQVWPRVFLSLVWGSILFGACNVCLD